MSVFTSLIILLLAMVIQAFLQTSPAVFAIFYHHALGKTSAKKADDRALSFILGVEIATAFVFLTTYIVITFFVPLRDFMNNTFLWIVAGILLALAIFTFFGYFKNGKNYKSSTALFYSRRFSEHLLYRIEHSKNRSDTIALGLITAALELLFTLPLYIICSVEIFNLAGTRGSIFLIAYIIVATIPLFIIRTVFRTGHNLAEIQRFRVEKKPFFRIILSSCYSLLALITFISGVIK